MSQRVAKIESTIQQVAAKALATELGRDAARVTVTRVDAAPDLHNATVWIGLLGNEAVQEALWKQVQTATGRVQAALAAHVTMKYAPRLHFKRDTGGEYAAEIDRLLRQL